MDLVGKSDIFEAIYPVYQPIVSLKDGTILGYEGLSRIKGEGYFSHVEDMFKEAERTGKIWQLEQVCRKAVLQGINKQRDLFELKDRKLFLNVNPKILHDEKFQVGFTKEYLSRYSIDDVGDGYASLNLICSVSPHFIKLDIHLIRNMIQNQINYAMIKGLVEFSLNSGILLIAEGIETKQELDMLIELGVQYGQGYYLYRPMPQLQTERKELCEEIRAEGLRLPIYTLITKC